MKKTFVRILCCLIPFPKIRRIIRQKLLQKNNFVFVRDLDGNLHRIKHAPKLHVEFYGNNNYVEVCHPLGSLIHLVINASNTRIYLGPTTNKVLLQICTPPYIKDRILRIGRNFRTTKVVNIDFACADGMIEIGDDCLFSWGISIRTGDHHTILQQGSHTILNKNKNIKIGDRVWVGSDVLILKGAEIPNDTVIGARSIVTKKFQETNTILAGTPAKVVKHNIEWATDNCFRYENNLCMT